MARRWLIVLGASLSIIALVILGLHLEQGSVSGAACSLSRAVNLSYCCMLCGPVPTLETVTETITYTTVAVTMPDSASSIKGYDTKTIVYTRDFFDCNNRRLVIPIPRGCCKLNVKQYCVPSGLVGENTSINWEVSGSTVTARLENGATVTGQFERIIEIEPVTGCVVISYDPSCVVDVVIHCRQGLEEEEHEVFFNSHRLLCPNPTQLQAKSESARGS